MSARGLRMCSPVRPIEEVETNRFLRRKSPFLGPPVGEEGGVQCASALFRCPSRAALGPYSASGSEAGWVKPMRDLVRFFLWNRLSGNR